MFSYSCQRQQRLKILEDFVEEERLTIQDCSNESVDDAIAWITKNI